jgi:hypothetical protein
MLLKQAAHSEPEASDAANAVRLASTAHACGAASTVAPSSLGLFESALASTGVVVFVGLDELLHPTPTAAAKVVAIAKVPSIQRDTRIRVRLL